MAEPLPVPSIPDEEERRVQQLYDAQAALVERVKKSTGAIADRLDAARVMVEISREIRLSHSQVFSQARQLERDEASDEQAEKDETDG